MIRTCLVLVPHPDDEINIGGGFFHQLRENGIITTVVITTNGDYIPELAPIRIKEAFKAKEYLGYDNLLFLGYGDKYIGKHIYDTVENEVTMSHSGHTETYNIGGMQTYHFNKYGCQSSYNHFSYKNDIKELILDILPDLILCVDTDSHQEHRCLSLLFDEAMEEIIKNTNYSPFVLKKFAYLGVFCGSEDYFTPEVQETKPHYQGLENVNLSYPYNWSDRVRFQNDSSNYTLRFWTSSIFKALLSHRSQKAFLQFTSICNSDVCFWIRNTKNIVLKSKLVASSGNVKYLNDFKIVETDSITNFSEIIEPSYIKCWRTDIGDVRPSVMVTFEKSYSVSSILIYMLPFSNCRFIIVQLSNGYTIQKEYDGSYVFHINIPLQIDIKHVRFSFIPTDNNKPISLSEIEILENKIGTELTLNLVLSFRNIF